MKTFDEELLKTDLAELSERAMLAFATATATRQLVSYELYALEAEIQEVKRPREILTCLWTEISYPASERVVWSEHLEEMTSLLPEDGDRWTVWHALAEDALASLMYAIRCLMKPDAQEAAWAGRRAYEATDQAAIRMLNLDPNDFDSEIAISSHPIVQRELAHQREDVALLRAGEFEVVRHNSYLNVILNQQEISLLRQKGS
ncbi:hypothetical protein CDN99_20060 [Roseateles aquatilis]|uniref:DUF416 domain-containing protein n=1 Tax=Roseateles aquatilis TaxID=431061 RepID=A0A246J352_9BURK|nr:DUF416 family protein [Roseateles aquatilis]OWQ86993.1 hypothetical protein CDN99_20060 [Roseateles aquatilis]